MPGGFRFQPQTLTSYLAVIGAGAPSSLELGTCDASVTIGGDALRDDLVF
ncbi:MAG: hypothetical protein RL346_1473 [Verrucomicrobiota bacterium]|jgi:hypothetical protein